MSGAAETAVGILVSDVDSTFLSQEVIELVAEHAGTRAEVEEVTTRAMRGELDFEESLRARVATLAGLPASVLAEVAGELVPNPGAVELVARARAAGWRTALVSGGFHEVIDALAAEAGIDHVLANRFAVREGRLTGEVSGPVIDRAAKAQALRDLAARYGVPLARTIGIGDGANDLDLIRTAGVGVAYRAKPVLREAADVVLEGPSLLDVWPVVERLSLLR
ncbi:phosphoserine phosphatase SerB [Brachybacterium sp. AOP25-B2-12]|uniref:phosphoserine phosphatase SerB n=1 Tax=Brachybacterium sp. AOP25-B2-12 TaxID=3457710 RepID=UPI0040341483